MKAQNKGTLESHLKTKNEHWNQFAYRLHCKAVESGLFADAAQPLQWVDRGIEVLMEHDKIPTKGVGLLLAEITKEELTTSQQLFVYREIIGYLDITEFEGKQVIQAIDLLQSHINRLSKEIEPVKPLVKDIRETLKQHIQKELEQLPDTLKDLEPEKRLNIICKLVPFILPRVDSIHPENGEPFNF